MYHRISIWPWVKIHSRSIIRSLWFIGFTLIIAITLYQIYKNWKEISTYAWQLKISYLLAGFLVYSISLVSTASVWTSIIKHLSGIKGYRNHIRLYAATNLAQRLPTLIPYLSARTEAYAALGIGRSVTLTAMGIDIISTLMSMLIIAVVTTPFAYYPLSNIQIAWVTFFVVIPMTIFVIKPRWFISLINWCLIHLRRSPIQVDISTKQMGIWISSYVLISIIGGICSFILINSIFPVPVFKLLLVVNAFVVAGIAGWLGQFFFFMPSLLFRQLVAAYLLSFFLPWPVAVAAAILSRLMIQVYELICVGIIQLTATSSHKSTLLSRLRK